MDIPTPVVLAKLHTLRSAVDSLDLVINHTHLTCARNWTPNVHADSFFYLPGIKLYKNNSGFRDHGINKAFYTYTYHTLGMPAQRKTRLQGHGDLPTAVERYTY